MNQYNFPGAEKDTWYPRGGSRGTSNNCI